MGGVHNEYQRPTKKEKRAAAGRPPHQEFRTDFDPWRAPQCPIIVHSGGLTGGAPIPMKIDTRAASNDDVGWLADLFTQSMQETITATRGSWDVVREDAQFRAQLQIADTRVIRVEGDDVGFLTVRTLDDRLLEVHTLCIQSDRQGAGIGARVMQEIMTAARTAGLAVELSVLRSNTRAEHFYARLGFAKIGASTHHIRMRWPVAEEG